MKGILNMLKRFLHYYKPHKKLFIMDMCASLLISLIGIIYPIVTREMLNNLIPEEKYKMIVAFGALLLGLYFVRMMLDYFVQYQGHVMGVKMQAQMRSDMFKKLQTLPYSFYDANETGKIMSRMTNDLMNVSELAHHGRENLIICSISIIISFLYLSILNIYLTVIIFLWLPLFICISLT